MLPQPRRGRRHDLLKLAADLEKLAQRPDTPLRVFMWPRFPNADRLPQFERDGVQVWSVTVP
jgi:hypothetical protein